MPSLLNTPVSRRSFLKAAGLAGAVISLRGIGAAEESSKQTFRVALLSDTHIPANPDDVLRGFNMVKNLKQITPDVVAMKPELIIHNGDAARLEGKVEDYKMVQDLLQPMTQAAPVCISMGNHDDRTNFATVFKTVAGEKQNVTGKNVMILEHPLLRFVVLDSLLYTNKTAGMLGHAQREWLAGYLPKVTDRPVVLFIHHSLDPERDGDLVDVDRLFKILEPHKHVKAIFYGHSHVWSITERQGVKLINLPAVGYNFADGEPVGWVESEFRADGVNLVLHAIGGKMADDGKKYEVKWG